jgi:Domain of unknown function (DUF1844)
MTPIQPGRLDEDALAGAALGEIHTALFLDTISGYAQMVLVLLGKAPNPETGGAETDIAAAKHFIDLLEMLQAKTRGNLNHDEATSLARLLSATQRAFAEALDAQAQDADDA